MESVSGMIMIEAPWLVRIVDAVVLVSTSDSAVEFGILEIPSNGSTVVTIFIR